MKIEVWHNSKIRFVDRCLDTKKLSVYFPWVVGYTMDSIEISPQIAMGTAIARLERYLEVTIKIIPHR